jgi:hypothetical protein
MDKWTEGLDLPVDFLGKIDGLVERAADAPTESRCFSDKNFHLRLCPFFISFHVYHSLKE